jgi:flagellar FliL protein
MSNKVLLIVIGVVLVLVIGMGGGLYLVWTKLASLNTQISAPQKPDAAAGKSKPEVIGPIFSLDTFIINLADPGGTRYLRVTMDLEIDGKPVEEELAKRLPQVRDAILMIVPSKRFADISTAEGKTQLREELIGALNKVLTSGKILRIYFKEFVIQ